ncbi:MAG: ABC transporter substrate-binding protein [Proteobacteria bacterium]|nr:ABC transporter substrate-binding protein [Pseudomonadota bacterium]
MTLTRRHALAAGTLAWPLAWPLAARAQAKKVPRVGVLWHAANADEESDYLPVIEKAFADLGYVDGKTIELLHRFPAEQTAQFHAMAQELADAKVDLIVAITVLGVIAARKATSTIPIVGVVMPDPVGTKLVESLARPGGNVTGLSLMSVDLSAKRLSLLKELVPGLARVAVIYDPALPSQGYIANFRKAAETLGLSLRTLEVATPEAIAPAFQGLAADKVDGVLVANGSMFFTERARLGAAALAARMPTSVNIAEMVPFGALMSYGPDFPDYMRRAAGYADRILKGAQPADLPVEQPTRIKLVLNRKAASALGLAIPPSLLALADDVVD